MSFKEILEKDLDTFMNPDEFAEVHLIEGKNVLCIIDSDVLEQRQGGTEFGICETNIQIYVKISELQLNRIEKKGYGAHLEVDGKMYTVMSWNENKGVSSIALSVPQMN